MESTYFTSLLGKLADYLLINGYSTEHSGLYQGKAGISLLLFEMARTLHDDRLDDHAFELLSQALLIRTENGAFPNGISGVGYALRYALERGFIEGEYEDLFGEQTEKVRSWVVRVADRAPLAAAAAASILPYEEWKSGGFAEWLSKRLQQYAAGWIEKIGQEEGCTLGCLQELAQLYRLSPLLPKEVWEVIDWEGMSKTLYRLYDEKRLALSPLWGLLLPDRLRNRLMLSHYLPLQGSLPFRDELFLAWGLYRDGDLPKERCFRLPLLVESMEEALSGYSRKSTLREGVGLYWLYLRMQVDKEGCDDLLHRLFLLPDLPAVTGKEGVR